MKAPSGKLVRGCQGDFSLVSGSVLGLLKQANWIGFTALTKVGVGAVRGPLWVLTEISIFWSKKRGNSKTSGQFFCNETKT